MFDLKRCLKLNFEKNFEKKQMSVYLYRRDDLELTVSDIFSDAQSVCFCPNVMFISSIDQTFQLIDILENRFTMLKVLLTFGNIYRKTE